VQVPPGFLTVLKSPLRKTTAPEIEPGCDNCRPDMANLSVNVKSFEQPSSRNVAVLVPMHGVSPSQEKIAVMEPLPDPYIEPETLARRLITRALPDIVTSVGVAKESWMVEPSQVPVNVVEMSGKGPSEERQSPSGPRQSARSSMAVRVAEPETLPVRDRSRPVMTIESIAPVSHPSYCIMAK
jgi:hypothetical protein